MACELLAGPFPLTLMQGNEATRVYANTSVAWLDGVGLVAIVWKGHGAVGCVVQLDGWASWRCTPYVPSMQVYSHNLETGGLAAYWGYITKYFSERVDPRTLFMVGEAIPATARWTVLPDRLIRVYDRYVRTMPRGGGADTIEATLPDGIRLNDALVSPAKVRERVFISGRASTSSPPVAYEYDWAARTFVGWRRTFGGYGTKGVHFSRELKVWITMDPGPVAPFADQIRIWADEVKPTSLSVPRALGQIARGLTTPFEVRVLGDSGDPAAGLLVNWSYAGPGSIHPVQSTTDADGYARVDYYAPIETLGTGTLSAEVRC